MPKNAEAVEQVNIDWDGKTLFNVKYYGASDYTDSRANFFVYSELPDYIKISQLAYDLTSNIKSGLNKSFKLWAEILGPGANISQPAQYFVGTDDFRNAGAFFYSYRNGNRTQNPNLFKEIFQSGQNMTQYDDIADIPIDMQNEKFYANDDTAFGRINIGQYITMDYLNDGGYGFLTSEYYASPTPQLTFGLDVSAVMFHEIGHSLRIGVFINNFSQTIGDITYYMGSFKDDFDEKSFSAHLYDQYGNKATPFSAILSSKEDISALNQYLEENPDKKSDLHTENIFCVPNGDEVRKD